MDQYREAANPKELAQALRTLADKVEGGSIALQSFGVGVGEQDGTFEMTIIYKQQPKVTP